MDYKWSKDLLEAGKQRLVSDTHWEADNQRVTEMRAENEQLQAVVAELTLKNRVLTLALAVRAKEKVAGQKNEVRRMIQRNEAEQREIIHVVECSSLSVKKTLDELAVPHSTFYSWFNPYCYT